MKLLTDDREAPRDVLRDLEEAVTAARTPVRGKALRRSHRSSAATRAAMQSRWEEAAIARDAPMTLADPPSGKRPHRVKLTKRGPRHGRPLAAE
jgi:hypothetical protein